jgi:hypothetical protein
LINSQTLSRIFFFVGAGGEVKVRAGRERSKGSGSDHQLGASVQVRTVHGFYVEVTELTRIVPLQESRLPTDGLPNCLYYLDKIRY